MFVPILASRSRRSGRSRHLLRTVAAATLAITPMLSAGAGLATLTAAHADVSYPWLGPDHDGDGLADGFEQSLAEKFAPVLYIEPDEQNYPVSVDWFLQRAHLQYHEDCWPTDTDDNLVGTPELFAHNPADPTINTQYNLLHASGPQGPHCGQGDTGWSHPPHTPLTLTATDPDGQGSWGQYSTGHSDQQTFVMPDLPLDERVGDTDPSHWPTYFHAYPTAGGGIIIQYWHLFAYNHLAAAGFGDHGGDWDAEVQVQLNSHLGVDGVWYSRHSHDSPGDFMSLGSLPYIAHQSPTASTTTSTMTRARVTDGHGSSAPLRHNLRPQAIKVDNGTGDDPSYPSSGSSTRPPPPDPCDHLYQCTHPLMAIDGGGHAAYSSPGDFCENQSVAGGTAVWPADGTDAADPENLRNMTCDPTGLEDNGRRGIVWKTWTGGGVSWAGGLTVPLQSTDTAHPYHSDNGGLINLGEYNPCSAGPYDPGSTCFGSEQASSLEAGTGYHAALAPPFDDPSRTTDMSFIQFEGKWGTLPTCGTGCANPPRGPVFQGFDDMRGGCTETDPILGCVNYTGVYTAWYNDGANTPASPDTAPWLNAPVTLFAVRHQFMPGSDGTQPTSETFFGLGVSGGIAPIATYYDLDGAGYTPYTGRVELTPGTHTVQYYSVDAYGRGGPGSAETKSVTVPQPTSDLDSTPPTTQIALAGTAGNAPWYLSPVTVTLTTPNDTDVESTRYSLDGGATWQDYTSPFTVDSNGAHTVLFHSADTSGNVEAVQSSAFSVDRSGPSISCTQSDGWHKADVTLQCTAADSVSGLQSSGDASFTLSTSVAGNTETANAETTSKSVCNQAGNCTAAGPFAGLEVDKRAPDISVAAATAGGAYTPGSWTNQLVTVTTSCQDGGSGLVPGSPPVPYTLDEGTYSATWVSCTDAVGNTASAQVPAIRIDRTPPTITYSGNAGTYTVDQQVSIHCAASDPMLADGSAGSGVVAATNSCTNVSGPAYGFPIGSNTVTSSASDAAGNTGTGATSFTIQVTAKALGNLVSRFCADSGVAASLIQQINDVAAAPNATSKAGKLSAFQNHVRAQAGKTLTDQQAQILLGLSSQL